MYPQASKDLITTEGLRLLFLQIPLDAEILALKDLITTEGLGLGLQRQRIGLGRVKRPDHHAGIETPRTALCCPASPEWAPHDLIATEGLRRICPEPFVSFVERGSTKSPDLHGGGEKGN